MITNSLNRIYTAAKSNFSSPLGVTRSQWITSILICALLLPMFAATAVGATRIETLPAGIEPVNPELPVWTEIYRDIATAIEKTMTMRRPVNSRFPETPEAHVSPATTADAIPVEEPEVPKPVTGDKTGKRKKRKAKPVVAPVVPSIAPPVFFNELPNDEKASVYLPENNLGAPPGQTEKDSDNAPAALRVRHRPGAANFNFGLPLAGIAGRGMSASVGLTYNSRTWNKSVNASSQDHFTYDVEKSWIAPGFASGFGYLESTAVLKNASTDPPNNSWHTEIMPQGITDPDGTRRFLECKETATIGGIERCTVYGTSDGSYIRFNARSWIANPNNSTTPNTSTYANADFSTIYPSGVRVWYSGGFGTGENRKHYPIIIQDRNGNRIRITYKADGSGRIDKIRDTLNRDIKFHYENDANGNPDKLAAITIPGMSNEDFQTVRFYYETMTLQSGGFVSSAEVTAPSSIRVLKYVFFPATKTGFKYEYHPYYGMIRKITRQAGMSASTTSTTVTGTLTEGVSAATTEYDFPAGTTALADVPLYTKRTDDWNGRTSADPQETHYAVQESQGVTTSTITVKDNGFDVVTSTVSNASGMISETSTEKIGPSGQINVLMAKSVFTWTGRNLTKLENTNEAGLVRKTEFAYDDDYNNQTSVKEYDYGSSNPTLLRTTEIEYETGSGWIANKLFSLPKTVKTIVGGNTVSKTVYEYDHGGNDSTLTLRTDIDTNTHDTFFNPSQPSWDEEVCPLSGENGCVIIHHPGYGAASAYRGNVTKVTSFSDASLTTDTNAVVNEFEYDIAGNNVSATVSCCNVKTIDYGSSFSQTGYAYPVKETKGSSPALESEATYNVYTGLVTSVTDENDQVTTYEYESDTLRPKKTIYPNGGYVQTEYSDKLVTNNNDLLPGFIRTTTTLESNKTVQTYGYFNGRGLGIRNASQSSDGWTVSATVFDHLGRPVKNYNPFVASTPTAGIPSDTPFSEITEFDALGRAVKVRLQDNAEIVTQFSTGSSSIPTGFNKTWAMGTDPAGKKRRQIFDSLGRTVRVDEPNAGGELGELDAPNQPTYYEYDANDNLSKVTQSDGTVTQERLFKYDSLSRLTHERQVEAVPTLNDAGTKVTSGGLWTKVLKYNDDGLLTDAYDANGVHTVMAYDGLNRLSSVTYSGESGYQTPTVNYTYDQARSGFYNTGALTKVTTAAVAGTQATPATETLYDFDQMGRLVKHVQTIGDQSYQIEYAYNLGGQLTSEKYPSGRIVTTGYDSKGRLSTVSDAQRTFLASAGFGANSLPSQLAYGNGTVQNFGYNDRLQMTSQELKRGSEVLQKYQYGFGELNSSNVLKNNGRLESVSSWIGTAQQWTQKFQYDSVGRLKEAKETKGDTSTVSYKQIFDYDRFGNLFRKSASNPSSGQENPLPYTAIETADIDPAKNRFTSQTGTAYNDGGQVVTDGKFRTLGYGYDANGRLVRASQANQPDAVSVYDALGNRVAEKVNDVWQFVIYDAFGKIVAEYGGTNPQDAGGVKYLMQDWQGSVRAGVNAGGYVKSRTDHQAFGEDIASGVGLRTTAQGYGAPATNRQGYGLTEKDSATGLNHTWFRKNENRAGRWTSPDPYNGSASVGNPQSWNRYSYVENQPTNYVDPSGLQWRYFDRSAGLGCVLGTDGRFHCTEYIERYWYWYEEGVGNPGTPEVGSFGDPTSCESNVDNLISIARYSSVTMGVLEVGRSLLKIALGYSRLDDGGRNLPIDGFKDELVSWGQRGHVYRHIYAHAGAVIIGDNLVVPGGAAIGRVKANETGDQLSMRELRDDIAQFQDPAHQDEATAEINGSNAGRRIGALLLDGMSKGEKANWNEIRSEILKHMCQ